MKAVGMCLRRKFCRLLCGSSLLLLGMVAAPAGVARAEEGGGIMSLGHAESASGVSFATGRCTGCDAATCSNCTANGSGIFDTLSLFTGLEGSKQPQDFGVNAHFGGRFAVNWGLPLWREAGVGAQIGTSINYTDNAVQVLERVAGVTERTQVFTTVGLFQRSRRFVWGIGYDFLQQDYYDDFDLGQWRGQFGMLLNPCNEFGARVALSGRGDDGQLDGTALRLEPIDQGALYWRRFWQTGTQTTAWIGLAEGHSEANLALGDLPPTGERLVFGADLHAPLNDWLAIWGEANFITPADTGTVDAYLGVAFYPGGGAFAAFRRNFYPVLPVANNPSFSVDLQR